MPQPPLPEGDEEVVESHEVDPSDMPAGWQLAFKRAEMKGCSPKAARLYADAHGEDFENDTPTKAPTKKEIEAEIARLQEQLGASS